MQMNVNRLVDLLNQLASEFPDYSGHFQRLSDGMYRLSHYLPRDFSDLELQDPEEINVEAVTDYMNMINDASKRLEICSSRILSVLNKDHDEAQFLTKGAQVMQWLLNNQTEAHDGAGKFWTLNAFAEIAEKLEMMDGITEENHSPEANTTQNPTIVDNTSVGKDLNANLVRAEEHESMSFDESARSARNKLFPKGPIDDKEMTDYVIALHDAQPLKRGDKIQIAMQIAGSKEKAEELDKRYRACVQRGEAVKINVDKRSARKRTKAHEAH